MCIYSQLKAQIILQYGLKADYMWLPPSHILEQFTPCLLHIDT